MSDCLPGDRMLLCNTCGKATPCRFRPSPEAGPYWRCSECGNICGYAPPPPPEPAARPVGERR